MAAPASGSPRGWRNAPLVREPDRKHARHIVSLFAALALAFSPVGLYVLQFIRHVEVDYAIEELRSAQEELTEAERRLWIERAELASLPDVERLASKEFGMVPSDPLRTIVLRRDGVSRTHSPDSESPTRAR